MKTIKGDLIKLALSGEFDVIVHGCNCFCNMGAGIAKQIRKHFPEAYRIDCQTKRGDKNKLGTISAGLCTFEIEYSGITKTIGVLNAYTQYRYGSGLHADYDAIQKCMRKIKRDFSGFKIGMPKIGAGLAGGDWETIKVIISEELADEDVTIVEWDGTNI